MRALNLPVRPVKWLLDNTSRTNMAEDLEDDTLLAIGQDVVQTYEQDKASRADWEQRIEAGVKIAKQVVEQKTSPWPGAANTKDGLMAEASAQFAARAGAEVVRGQDVVKVKVSGKDADGAKEARAKRVGAYLSYQCTDGMPEWYRENDQLLTSLSLFGMYYKKTYRDPLLGRNVSIARSPLNVVVHDDVRSLETAPRITDDHIYLTVNDVLERVRGGLWLDVTEHMGKSDDLDLPEQFLEQHRRLDLDGDGYQEPYVVTVHKESGRVCRIIARYTDKGIVRTKDGKVGRIEPVQYFTEFPFLLSPDGKFHKIGWAHLLGPNTEVVNTIVNQLLDAGSLANTPPVFVGKGAKLPAGGLRVQPGRVVPIESNGQAVRDNLVVMQTVGPSDVLFKLLGLLSERGQKLAHISDSMQGEISGPNVPATTTLALLDQALKVYTSILKRLFQAYKEEFQKLYALEAQYLTDDEYVNIVDEPTTVQADFSLSDHDIQPVMDPMASSEAIRLARLNAMAQAAEMPPAVGRLYLQGIGVPDKDVDLIFPPADPNNPPPPPPEAIKLHAEVLAMQRKAELDTAASEREEALACAQIEEIRARTVLIKAQGIKALADAEAVEVGTQIDVYKTELADLTAQVGLETAAIEREVPSGDSAGHETGRPGALEESGVDQEGAGIPGAEGAGGGGGLEGGQLPPELLGGGGALDADPLSPPAGLQHPIQPRNFSAPE